MDTVRIKAGEIIYYKPLIEHRNRPSLEYRARVKRLIFIEPDITILLVQPIIEGTGDWPSDFIFLAQVTRKEEA